MEWYKLFWQNYFTIDGRARRTAYWIPWLINFAVMLILPLIEGMLYGMPVLSLLYWLAIIIPVITVTIRRLHDTGKSGWWVFIILIPIIGGIVLIIFMVLDSQPGPNRFGPNPKTGGGANQYNQNYQGYQG